MGTLVTSVAPYQTEFSAKAINALATVEATITRLEKVYGFGANPPTLSGIDPPFVLHMVSGYTAQRVGLPDKHRAGLTITSIIPCIYLPKYIALGYPTSEFEAHQTLIDVYYTTFGDQVVATKQALCDACGATDFVLQNGQYGPFTNMLENWLGWSINFFVKRY